MLIEARCAKAKYVEKQMGGFKGAIECIK